MLELGQVERSEFLVAKDSKNLKGFLFFFFSMLLIRLEVTLILDNMDVKDRESFKHDPRELFPLYLGMSRGMLGQG